MSAAIATTRSPPRKGGGLVGLGVVPDMPRGGIGSSAGSFDDAKRGCEMRVVSAFATIWLAVLLCVGAQPATAAPPDEVSLRQALDRLVAAGVPGAVLLVRDGGVLRGRVGSAGTAAADS